MGLDLNLDNFLSKKYEYKYYNIILFLYVLSLLYNKYNYKLNLYFYNQLGYIIFNAFRIELNVTMFQ